MMHPYGEILERFAAISKSKESVKLLNVYKGIPISHDATVEKVIQGSTIFGVHKYQATCLELHRISYIKSQHLGGTVRGNVLSVDFIKEAAAVTGFHYVSESIGNRVFVRVQPEEPLLIEMMVQKQEVRGHIVDISPKGVGMRTTNPDYDPATFPEDTDVILNIVLPDSGTSLRIRGQVRNVITEKEYHRIGIKTTPDAEAKALLKDYIARREAELMRELKTMYDAFYRLQSAKER